MYGQTYGQVQRYMLPTLWGHKNWSAKYPTQQILIFFPRYSTSFAKWENMQASTSFKIKNSLRIQSSKMRSMQINL
jgi:hypothetical protein